jgi:hypothetical protein
MLANDLNPQTFSPIKTRDNERLGRSLSLLFVGRKLADLVHWGAGKSATAKREGDDPGSPEQATDTAGARARVGSPSWLLSSFR